MAHETFGQYLLLKKLSEDALGELFRAGRLRDGNLEQVVLLRVYNAPGIDAEAVGRGVAAREGVHAVLRSPNLAQGLESGTLQGIPYAIYDYISGRDLGALMRQASNRSHPVPTEHALLIAERLALGLSVAHGSKVGPERVLHGFLVPPMVMLSNEGENRILGFEASPALRSAGPSSQVWSQFSRYLSPEAHAGQPLVQADDVYSLGVILLELLVGHSLENLGPSSLQGAVAQVAGRGLPNVASLIEKSIAPAGERIESAAAWHEQLNRLVLDRESSSTPFHLAFYMHNLFRDEIEMETQEIEHEKSLDFSREKFSSVPPSQPPPAEESAVPLVGSAPLAAATTPTPAPPAPEPASKPPAAAAPAKPKQKEKSSNKLLWILPAAVLLLAVGGYFAWQQMKPGSPSTPAAPTSSPEPTSLAELPATDPAPGGSATALLEGGPVEDARTVAEGVESDTVDPNAAEREGTREQLMAELDRLVDERTQAAAEGLKQEYDQEVADLRAKLQAAEEERLEQERREQEAAAARLKAQQEEEARLEQQRQQAAEEERKRKEAEQQAETEPADQPQRAATNTRTVREGELVQPGPGVVRPRLMSELKPVYPFAAQRLRREADVDVDVLVDENGNVVDTRLAKKAGFGFDDAARTAATNAKFAAATSQGVKVKMWTTIKVRFRLDN